MKYQLKNPHLSLTVLPVGAKIASLKYHGRELFFLPSQQIIDNYSPDKDQVFDETVAWGGDICVPSVSACVVEKNGYSLRVSDHGNFWTTVFTVEKYDREKNLLHLRGVTKEYTLLVTFSLRDNVLRREYEAINNTKHTLPFTFADHLLLPINKDKNPRDYLKFPGVEKMRVEWSFNNLLGEKNDIVSWPLLRKGIFADKLFGLLKKDPDGKYFLEYQNKTKGKKYYLQFSSKELPYVGYWQTEGAWNDSYNLGVELTNTDRDNLTEGIKENKVWWIKQGKSKKWSIDLEITHS